MKQLPNIIGLLLGIAFLIFGINFFYPLSFVPSPPKSPPGSPAAMFFGAIFVSGFLGFIKALEIIGAIFVAIPKTRNWGLLILGPIIIGIIAVNVYIKGGTAVIDPVLIAISVMAAYLLWDARAKFLNLLNK